MGSRGDQVKGEERESDPFLDLFTRMLAKCLELRVVTVDEVESALTARLSAECEGCRARLDGYAAVLAGAPSQKSQAAVYDRLFDSAPKARATRRRENDRDRRREQAMASLRPLTHHQRLEQIQLRHYYFRGAAAARLFLLEARALLPGDPPESALYASYAETAAGIDRALSTDDPVELTALAFRADLYKANALRCAGELPAAALAFENAMAGAQQLRIRDVVFWTEVKFFRASLLRAQRRFPEAIREARLAAAFFRALDEKVLEVQALLKIGTIYEQQGDFRSALGAAREAIPSALALDSAELRLTVLHSEVGFLIRSGDAATARARFEALSDLYVRFPSWEPWREWAGALIHAALCESIEAAEAFQVARNGFLSTRNAYDAALVTLDWSLFLLDQNCPEEVLPLAVSMGQAFEALGVARETLASWAIFQAAAERRELTRAVAESVVRTLGEERVGAKSGR